MRGKAREFPFADALNSQARQSAAERAWAAITRFHDNCKSKNSLRGFPPKQTFQDSKIPEKKGFPKFQKDCRSVEYKATGWKLAEDRKSIIFTDKKGIGKLKLKGTRDLHFYQPEQIKRVRLVKKADGYYTQFCVAVNRAEIIKPTHQTIGLDVGLSSFYTDSQGNKVGNPQFYRTGEQKLKRSQRFVSRKIKGSRN